MRIRIANADGSVTTVEGLIGATVRLEAHDAKLSEPTAPQQDGHRGAIGGAWRWERRQQVQDADGNLLTLVLFSRDATDLLGDPAPAETSDA